MYSRYRIITRKPMRWLAQRLCSLDYDVNNIAIRTFVRARKWIHYKYYSERADLTGPHNEITRGKSSRLV